MDTKKQLFILDVIHRIVVYFMVFGFILPKKYLKFHLLTYPLIWLHWKLNNNKCFLTELEYKLKGIKYEDTPSYNKDHDFPYMRKIFNEFGLYPSDESIHQVVMATILVSWLISFTRLFIIKK